MAKRQDQDIQVAEATESSQTVQPSQPSVRVPSDQAAYDKAIADGLELLATSNSKAAAAREIYRQLHQEHREVVLKAFVEGATITLKGAPTYYYNISRKFRKLEGKAKKDEVV